MFIKLFINKTLKICHFFILKHDLKSRLSEYLVLVFKHDYLVFKYQLKHKLILHLHSPYEFKLSCFKRDFQSSIKKTLKLLNK